MNTNKRTGTLARSARVLHRDVEMGLRLSEHRGRLRIEWTVHPDPAAAGIQLQNLRVQLEAVEHDLVGKLRALGFSWDDIGRAFGMSRQGAQKKFAGGGPRAARGTGSRLRTGMSRRPHSGASSPGGPSGSTHVFPVLTRGGGRATV